MTTPTKRARDQAFAASPAGRAAQRRYRQSDKGLQNARECSRRYYYRSRGRAIPQHVLDAMRRERAA